MNKIRLLWKLTRLKGNEKKTGAQLKALQEKKLKRLLEYTWENSLYYRNAFEKAGISREEIGSLPLSAFPTIDKKALLEHFDELVTAQGVNQNDLRAFDAREAGNRNAYLKEYHVVHSSGSTGKPSYFVYDEAAWNDMLAGMIRAALWGMSVLEIVKFLAEGPRIVYVAATDGRYGGAMAVGDGAAGLGVEQLTLDIKQPLSQWKERLRAFKPNMIIGYPSAVKIMAELLERGELSIEADRVVTCGEPLSGGLRSYLERVFETRVINFYGSSESLVLGVETDQKEGMVLFDDLNIIEVVDGEMYVTCLYNYVQPLIRYHISDRLVLRETGEESRYPFATAAGIMGREEDLLWFEDRAGQQEFLHPLAIEGFCVEGLKDYQFRQTGKDTFEMLAETEKTAQRGRIRRELLGQMREILAQKHLEHVQFYVNFVDEIFPDTRTGKKKLIVKEALAG